jgi:hypothetical protein
MSKALGPKGELSLGGTNSYVGGTTIAGGTTMSKAAAADSPMPAKYALAEVAAKDALRANDRVAKDGETFQFMNGSSDVNGGTLSTAGQVAVPNAKSGPTMQSRFAGGQAAPETYVLNVSKLAVQNKVFENLLARQGLGSYQNSTNVAQNAPADKSGPHFGLVEQATQDDGQRQTRQQILSDNRSTGSESIRYEFDATSAQLATVIKQIGERSNFFSAPKIEPPVSDSPGSGSLAQNGVYANNFRGGVGGGGGFGGGGGRGRGGRGGRAGGVPPSGVPASDQGQQQAMALAGSANLSLKGAPQPQAVQSASSGSAQPAASPAAGIATQHVVFVLNVVDHLAPAAGPASQLPAGAAPVQK